jgi:polyisoprenoid-binding protein YceI
MKLSFVGIFQKPQCTAWESPAGRTTVPGMKSMPAVALSLLLASTTQAFSAQVWTVDPIHSTAQFTAKHFGIVPVVGTIPIVSASVTMNGSSQIPLAVSAQLDPTKEDTHFEMRDNDVRSAHFLDAATYPSMKFVSTKIDGTDPQNFTIAGDLTMHGQTHPVTLAAHVVGAGTSPRGQSIVAYAATTTIDRTQWGMTFGPMIVGNSVDIALNIEADGPRSP